jgi:hypothetical protein
MTVPARVATDALPIARVVACQRHLPLEPVGEYCGRSGRGERPRMVVLMRLIIRNPPRRK